MVTRVSIIAVIVMVIRGQQKSQRLTTRETGNTFTRTTHTTSWNTVAVSSSKLNMTHKEAAWQNDVPPGPPRKKLHLRGFV
jgi:hypothetical protein